MSPACRPPATATERSASLRRQRDNQRGKWEEMKGETCTCPTTARQSLISHERRGLLSERFGHRCDSFERNYTFEKKKKSGQGETELLHVSSVIIKFLMMSRRWITEPPSSIRSRSDYVKTGRGGPAAPARKKTSAEAA